MPRSRTGRHNKDAPKESGRKREQLFAPEQDEWQRLSPNRLRSENETNSGQTKFDKKTGPMTKSLTQRSKVRRHRSISNQRSKDEKPKYDQPMISGRARKTASKSDSKSMRTSFPAMQC